MTILLTGATGSIGRRLRPLLLARYGKLLLLDRVPIDDVGVNEQAFVGDIADTAFVQRAMKGCTGVVHLSGMSVEAPFEVILQSNIIGLWNVYEAARLNGTGRIVFASSNHAVGFYRRDQTIDHTVLPRPDTRYGLSKCWGEAVGALYADKYNVKSLHLRIGNAGPKPDNLRQLAIWISIRDLAQLCAIGLEHPAIHNDIVYGISRNSATWYDNSHAYALGYQPQDSSDTFLAEAQAGEPNAGYDAVGQMYQGGPFCSMEYAGPPVTKT